MYSFNTLNRVVADYGTSLNCRDETHKRNLQKEAENERVAAAFGISPNFVSGAAFNKELQQQKKEQVYHISYV